MHYVYLLRSVSHPKQVYIGATRDLKTRLAQYNAGKSIHTNRFKPWGLAAYIALPTKEPAAHRRNFGKFTITFPNREKSRTKRTITGIRFCSRCLQD